MSISAIRGPLIEWDLVPFRWYRSFVIWRTPLTRWFTSDKSPQHLFAESEVSSQERIPDLGILLAFPGPVPAFIAMMEVEAFLLNLSPDPELIWKKEGVDVQRTFSYVCFLRRDGVMKLVDSLSWSGT